MQRGLDFTLYEFEDSPAEESGGIRRRATRVSLVGNGLNYQENGEWKESQDIIERFPGGAIAKHGPNKGIFRANLNARAVFEITGRDGKKIAGGVREIRLTDNWNGGCLVLGRPREGARGEVLHPNKIVYRDAFEGVTADLVLVWERNAFSHDVVLRERVALPSGFDPRTTSLEIVTEFVEAPNSEVRCVTLQNADNLENDHAVVRFGSMDIIPGMAFSVSVENGLEWGGLSQGEGIPVKKRWQTVEGGGFLVESVGWLEIQPELQKLPNQRPLSRRDEAACGQDPGQEMMLAREPYSASGCVVDWTLVPVSNPPLFATGETYIVRNVYYLSSPAVFEPGTIIKFWGNNLAEICFYWQPPKFPRTEQLVVLTSIDDDSYGEKIPEIRDEQNRLLVPASDGNPDDNRPARTLRVWQMDRSTEIQSTLLRWTRRGIEYFQRNGLSTAHNVRGCRFEKIPAPFEAISVNLPTGNGLGIIDCEMSDVATPVKVSQGKVSGTPIKSSFVSEKGFYGFGRTSRTPPEIFLRMNNAVPDTMGAVGLEHFVELVNASIVIFDKTNGLAVEHASASRFFTGAEGADLADPRIMYDHEWGRWIATMFEKFTGKVYCAVSEGANPLNLSSWRRFVRDVSVVENGQAYFVDYPTLGFDGNGIYIATRMTPMGEDPNHPTRLKYAIIPIKKPIGGGMVNEQDVKPTTYLTEDVFTGYMRRWILPVTNYDAVSPNGFGFLLSKGDPLMTGGQIHFCRFWWAGNNFHLENTWTVISNFSPGPYYDLDNDYAYVLPQKPPPGVNSINRLAGSRLHVAILRNGFLWACHHIGLNGTDGNYTGPGKPDRLAIQWMKAKLIEQAAPNRPFFTFESALGGAVERILDDRVADPYSYAFPSLAVNEVGDMVVGFSCARASEYIGAAYWGKRVDGSTTPRPVLIQPGRSLYDHPRWGDYSATSIDPVDGSFWTIQEYADLEPGEQNAYGLWIQQVKANP